MERTPQANRLKIGIFGRRNVGKSSLINCLTGQDVALVSERPGTTTDPVSKAMEIPLLGPVVLIDTAGLDDEGALGELRIQRSKKILTQIHVAILVTDPQEALGPWEEEILSELTTEEIPVLIVINKKDLVTEPLPQLPGKTVLAVNSLTGEGRDAVLTALQKIAPTQIEPPTIAGDLIAPGQQILLVMPQGKGAPKGRLILPQVQTIRDLLDHRGVITCVQPGELKMALALFKNPPALTIVDSQVFKEAAAVLPKDAPLTSFSILFARFKGNLRQLAAGVEAIERLQPNDTVYMIEGCTHHAQDDDIGRVKIPNLLEKQTGGKLNFHWFAGKGFPDEIDAKLAVFCGGCMLGRKEVLTRLAAAEKQGIPAVNYGVLLAAASGILPRALAPFEAELQAGEKS